MMAIALIYLLICKGEIVVEFSVDKGRKAKPYKKKDNNDQRNSTRKVNTRP